MGQRVTVCTAEELPPGGRRLVAHNGRDVGVFNIAGSYFAVRNRCPHMAAPLCAGRAGGTMQPSRPHEYVYDNDAAIIACPWHHWEFRLDTGRCVTDPSAIVKTYEVTVEDGNVMLHV